MIFSRFRPKAVHERRVREQGGRIPLNVCPVERRCFLSTRSDGWPRCGECAGCRAEAAFWAARGQS